MTERTRNHIAQLHVDAQPWAAAHMQAIGQSREIPPGWRVEIISSYRSVEEQDRLFAQGRTRPGQRVTNARGGQSLHNYRLAWDLGLFGRSGEYVGRSPVYASIAPLGEQLGLEWGGRWRSRDEAHYQMTVGLTVAQIRARVRRGLQIPVPPLAVHAAAMVPEEPVQVFDGAQSTTIPAFLAEGRVWVAVRAYVERFGGAVLNAEDGRTFIIGLHGTQVAVLGVNRGGVGLARFADINRLHRWPHRFDSGSPHRLTILTGREDR